MTGIVEAGVSEKSRRLVFHYLVEEHARRQPDKPCLVMDDRVLTWGQVEAQANRWARGLQRHGIGKGDPVLVMIPSGIDHVLIWLGLCKLGALMVPVNAAYRGRMLEHQAVDSGARLAILDARHLPQWRAVGQSLTALETVAVYPDVAEPPGDGDRWTSIAAFSLRDDDPSPMPPVVAYTDPMAIFYTSGTTGPSKGVVYGYAQAHATAAPLARLCDADEVVYMFLPMFHVGLAQMFGFVAIAGATMAIAEKFSARSFWPDVRRYRATMSILLSSMPAFLAAEPPGPGDREHTLAKMVIIPLMKDIAAFKARFGFEVTTFYNMTEVSVPLAANGFDLVDAASCGRPRAGITARIVDERDEPVPVGDVGELVLRSDDPWQFNLGYWRNPEKTAEAWRNQWLHTGDAFRCDAAGNYYFVDRLKDAIRRRGENISSYEVEVEVDSHPAVLESAAVAVPSPAGEDEVMVAVALKPGYRLAPEELIAHLAPRLPAYMVPRFVRIVSPELPKTPTGKIRKAALREAGTSGAYDREQHGATDCSRLGSDRSA